MKVLEKLRSINNGGIEAFVFNTTLLINNPDIDICYCSDTAPQSVKWTKAIQKTGRKLYCLKTNSSFDFFCRTSYIFQFYFLCKQHHFDIVHIHMYGAYDAVYAFAAKAAGTKKIIRHSHFGLGADQNIPKKVANSLFRTLCKKSKDICIACSDSAAKYMFGENEYILVKNGIDINRFTFSKAIRNDVRNSLGIKNSFVIGHIGRFSKQKNHLFLLDVFAKTLEKKQNCTLLLAGDGELMQQIKHRAQDLDIIDKIIFCGSVDDPAKLYSAMDCFVFPSFCEGLGIVAIEAQASGLYTICADTVPPEAAVTGLCEFLPLSAPPAVWADKILSYDIGYERRDMSEQIRAAGYNINDTAKKLEELYINIMSESK